MGERKGQDSTYAIEGYERVTDVDPESKEADQAREAILGITKKFEKERKRYSAYYLYQKIAYGKERVSKKAV